MNEDERRVLYVLGILHELRHSGLIHVGSWHLEPKGVTVWDQVLASSERPDDETCLMIMDIMGVGPEDAIEALGKWDQWIWRERHSMQEFLGEEVDD